MVSEQQIVTSRVAAEIIQLNESGRKDLLLPHFLVHHHRLDDTAYWQILATIWQDAPWNTANLEIWISLFSSSRSNRHKMMKKTDRKRWRQLPAQVKCYRALTPGEDVVRAICWTTQRVSAEFFQRQKQGFGWESPIVERVFPKSRIIAFFDRRSENEVIVLPEANF